LARTGAATRGGANTPGRRHAPFPMKIERLNVKKQENRWDAPYLFIVAKRYY
jgi:hypothetical protein